MPTELVRSLLDKQHALASEYMWMLGTPFAATMNPASSTLVASFHKNSFSFFAASDLNERGMFGPARVLLRSSFEGLMVAKFCAVSGDAKLLTRWTDGEPLNLSTDVLRRIAAPEVVPFKDFWKLLCHYAHASVYSQQFDPRLAPQAVKATFALVVILLNMSRHLLVRHLLTRGMSYYAGRYANVASIGRARADLVALTNKSFRQMSKDARALIRAYRARWSIDLKAPMVRDKQLRPTASVVSIAGRG